MKLLRNMRNIEYQKEDENEDEADEIRSEEMSADEDEEDMQEWIDPEKLQDKNRKKKRWLK